MSSEVERQTASLTDDDDWVRAVASLIRLTEQGKLKWKSELGPRSLQREPEKHVDVVFTTEFEGKKLRLYIETTRVDDEIPLLNVVGIFKRKYPYWTEEAVLELGDQSEHGWYTFPHSEAVEELLDSVKYHVFGVDDFLNTVLEVPGA